MSNVNNKEKDGDVTAEFEEALDKQDTEQYVLRLYIAGNNLRSQTAIENIKNICEENLNGRFELEIIDIYQDLKKNVDDMILAAPTLIKQLPLPLRRMIGDMTNKERILVGLDIIPRRT